MRYTSIYSCRSRQLHYGYSKRWLLFDRCCRRFAARFTAVGPAVYTTVRVNAARFLSRSCRRYAAHFTAVVAAVYTTARVNAARFSAVGVGVMLPSLTAVGAAVYTTARVIAARCLSAVGLGVTPPIIMLLAPPFTLRRG